MTEINWDRLKEDIRNILYDYISVESYTYSKSENNATEFLESLFSKLPYFIANRELFGSVPVVNDPFNRSVFWAMLKGEGRETVVLIHHSDVVSIEDFKTLKNFAFKPDELQKKLLAMDNTLSPDARKDLNENTFLFGRGGADMKAGGSIQISLLKQYSELDNFEGNVVLLAVPDEENLSSGMRRATGLLNDLKERYGLEYRLMINSEPHQRKDFSKGVFSTGSVGKVMPFFYVRGSLSHIGKVFEGLNPLNVMNTIVNKTELNMTLSDVVENEASPPPTWLYLRDSKTNYDVSMPLSASGCCSILTLGRTLQQLMDDLREICVESFDDTIRAMNESYSEFLSVKGMTQDSLPWKTKVSDFADLYKEAEDAYGEEFVRSYNDKMDELIGEIREERKDITVCNFELIEHMYDYIDDTDPRIVYGMIPPYYPAVSNILIDGLDDVQKNIASILETYTKTEFNQEYETELFYTGISDLSYSGIRNGDEIKSALERTMPLYGKFYTLPIEELEKLSMPVINIGPWGKDFHKISERVNIEDLYARTPKILDKAIRTVIDR